jgi:short subunit dehydrogenase-like uncharacterized protein
VFERWDAPARTAGAGLITAFGYDYVPGNLAAALALERAGESAAKVAIGYFISGKANPKDAVSGGTASSLAGVMLSPSFAFRGGRVVTERSAKRVRSFDAGSKRLTGISVGSSEHFALPKIHPSLREVDVYLGWFGPASRVMQVMTLSGELPGVRAGVEKLGRRFVKGSSGGPDEAARSRTGSIIVAEVYDAAGTMLTRVEMKGPNGYTFTGEVLAWGAQQALEHGLQGSGALGPAEAFGLRALEVGCAELGLTEVGAPAKTAAGW